MLIPLLRTMRPKQWFKNLAVFAALLFDLKLFQPDPFARATFAFVLFCLLSSVVYIINDLADIERDRLHPVKRLRPLASGTLSPRVAAGAAGVFLAFALVGAFWMDTTFGLLALLYLAVNVAYSAWLKHVVILDALLVASGFVIRAAAGAVVVYATRFSPWLYVCTTLFSLFLSLSKRRHEAVLLEGNGANHRQVLSEYSPALLDEMISVVTSSTVIAYSLYTFSAPNLPQNHAMMLTIPFVLYGIFRYLYLVHQRNLGGSPELILLTDVPIIIDVLLWIATIVAILYFFS